MSGGRRTYIGLAVVALLAFALVATPDADGVANVVTGLLRAAFMAVIAVAVARLYRARSGWLAELPERNRGLLYGAVATALLVIVGTARFGSIGVGGILIEVLLLMGCAGAAVWVWYESRRYAI